jgi:hypothetical protein
VPPVTQGRPWIRSDPWPLGWDSREGPERTSGLRRVTEGLLNQSPLTLGSPWIRVPPLAARVVAESPQNAPVSHCWHVGDLTRMSIGHSTNVGNCADWTFSSAALIAQKNNSTLWPFDHATRGWQSDRTVGLRYSDDYAPSAPP